MSNSAHRKSHRKSRNGCLLCKRRHVKCDEEKPTCGNCLKLSIDCEYHGEKTAAALVRKLGRPRKPWTAGTQSLAYGLPPTPPDDSPLPVHEPRPTSLNLDDLELLHHFSTSTYFALGDGAVRTMWRDSVPALGMKYPFVLRLTLAMAARHLQILRPRNRSEHYATLAEEHFTVALAEVLRLLPNLDTANCQALYISSVIICLYFFARGPAEGEYLLFGKNGPSQFIPLIRGVRSIRESLATDVVFSGHLAALNAGPNLGHTETSTADKHQTYTVRWEEPLQSLRDFIGSIKDIEVAGICLPAIDSLSDIYEAIYGKYGRPYQGDMNNQMVLRWLYCLDVHFIAYLEQKQPIALILCAYFALVMSTLNDQDCWFMNGWTVHIMVGIQGNLAQEYQVWLQWPMEQVRLPLQDSSRTSPSKI